LTYRVFCFFWCVIFSHFFPLSAAFIDTKLTHRMTHQKDVPIPEHNQHCQVQKTHKKRLNLLHLTYGLKADMIGMAHSLNLDSFTI